MNAIKSTPIRPATEADLPQILAITNEAIANTTAVWSLAPASLESRRIWWQERCARRFPVLVVAGPGERILGFGSFGDFRPWEGYLHTVEHSIYIETSARGNGLGSLLLVELMQQAQHLGKHVMVAGIEAQNEASIRLHEKLGFVETGRLHEVGRKFDRWLDLVFMQYRFADTAASTNRGTRS